VWKYYEMLWAYRLLGWLPDRIRYGIARIISDLTYLLGRNMRRNVTANMRQVLGPQASEQEVRRCVREAFRNAGRYYADLIHIPRLDIDKFRRERLQLEGLHYLTEARDAGRGAVVVSAHFGNPEMAVQGLASAGVHLYALTEPLDPPQLSDLTHWLRSQHGHVYRTVSFGAVKEAIRRLKHGGLIAILVDRDIQGNGVPVQFFGAEMRIPLGAIDLALRSGADIVPAWVWRKPGYRYHAVLGPPLPLVRTGDADADVQANAQALMELCERVLRSDPGQWLVMERVWPLPKESKAPAKPAVQ
jgi:KDO2-lipid IV(A) lauroyltransferase